jgi:hypothetical protein
MNIRKPTIEAILSRAPQPQPPADLRQMLFAQVRLPLFSSVPKPSLVVRSAGHWLRRWGFVLAPAGVTLACAVVFTVQQAEINDLKATLRALSPPPSAAQPSPDQARPATNRVHGGAAESPAADQEIARLKQQALQLDGEVQRLERMGDENKKLRAQLAVASTLPPEMQADLDAMEKTKAKAEAIRCVNNLKQLGLAVRLWSMDNAGALPPDVRSMSNEISSLKVAVCPADPTRQPAQSWATFTSANSSYQYFGPGGRAQLGTPYEPNRVLFLCPIHGSVTLADGSVQMEIAKTHPDWLVRSNGVLYLQGYPAPNPAAPGASPPAGTAGTNSPPAAPKP